MRGTILLSPEGINLFLAGRPKNIEMFWTSLLAFDDFRDMEYKASYSARMPFKRLRVKVKNEIIPMSTTGVKPDHTQGNYIPPRELKRWLDEGRNIRLLDTRNDYEVSLGRFKGAEHLDIESFRAFPERVNKLPSAIKNRPVLLYCTGGIRCEKAAPLLQQNGFQEVYQLEGGILKYFEESGVAHFVGECFVFDERVGLNSQLQETPTVLCDRCQFPVSFEQQQTASYKPGDSCPHCIEGFVQQQTARARRENKVKD